MDFWGIFLDFFGNGDVIILFSERYRIYGLLFVWIRS